MWYLLVVGSLLLPLLPPAVHRWTFTANYLSWVPFCPSVICMDTAAMALAYHVLAPSYYIVYRSSAVGFPHALLYHHGYSLRAVIGCVKNGCLSLPAFVYRVWFLGWLCLFPFCVS